MTFRPTNKTWHRTFHHMAYHLVGHLNITRYLHPHMDLVHLVVSQLQPLLQSLRHHLNSLTYPLSPWLSTHIHIDAAEKIQKKYHQYQAFKVINGIASHMVAHLLLAEQNMRATNADRLNTDWFGVAGIIFYLVLISSPFTAYVSTSFWLFVILHYF